MEPLIKHRWDINIQEAKKLQCELAGNLRFCPFPIRKVKTVAAVDVSYSRFDKTGYAVLGIFEVEQNDIEKRFEIKKYDIFEHV
ncbi:MAG: hypothetical protein DRP88_07005, partial [Candidatus Neomarinimicrobiota bacterium]